MTSIFHNFRFLTLPNILLCLYEKLFKEIFPCLNGMKVAGYFYASSLRRFPVPDHLSWQENKNAAIKTIIK